jgi:hypothetical protein
MNAAQELWWRQAQSDHQLNTGQGRKLVGFVDRAIANFDHYA